MGVEWGGEGEGEADRKELRDDALQKIPKHNDRRWTIRVRPAQDHRPNRYDDNEPITNSKHTPSHQLESHDIHLRRPDLSLNCALHHFFPLKSTIRKYNTRSSRVPPSSSRHVYQAAKCTTSITCQPTEQLWSRSLPQRAGGLESPAIRLLFSIPSDLKRNNRERRQVQNTTTASLMV